MPRVTLGAARFGGCPSDLAGASIRLRGRDLRFWVVARQVGPEAAPLTFLARAPGDRRANESEEEFFLTSPMKSVDGLAVVEASRVRGAEQYRDMVRDLYEAISQFMRAEKPTFVWAATTVSTRFGFTDRKPVEQLFVARPGAQPGCCGCWLQGLGSKAFSGPWMTRSRRRLRRGTGWRVRCRRRRSSCAPLSSTWPLWVSPCRRWPTRWSWSRRPSICAQRRRRHIRRRKRGGARARHGGRDAALLALEPLALTVPQVTSDLWKGPTDV